MLDVSPQLISAVENGRRDLTFDISPTGYSQERFDIPDMSEPLHRQRAATWVADTHRAKELLRLAGEVFGELRNRIPKTPLQNLEHIATPTSVDAVEASTLVVRSMLAQEDTGPIRDLTAAAERAGVCLIPLVGLKGIDGMSTWVGDQPVIGLSPNVPGDRFRFSLAHELGHLIFHRTKGEITEDQANRFAGALLISEEEMELALPDRPTVRDYVRVKNTWGIAVAALVYRSRELGLIDDRRYRSLQIQMSRWREFEPGKFWPVLGSLLPRMVETEKGSIAVAEALGLRWQHVKEITNWALFRVA